MGDPHRFQVDCFSALSANPLRANVIFVSAEVVYQKLDASITLEVWKRSARQNSGLLPTES